MLCLRKKRSNQAVMAGTIDTNQATGHAIDTDRWQQQDMTVAFLYY